ncbi:Squamous cell carcinoma antigen recognized by T-cells 3 like [Actinidia chinensis var. chinensis]|uniref:Squamous cell carcinoma antigen recognized by T-cells 3 like n=1 Tax=Actinidia chinensis var. chinensis TaxID=1590841 RepID=A0A2R6Q1P5_ACTCC|nr:Squamous cell carcinoma antigen recognized by T-cells 3 like [Actinidia chinensis var. chinensis]
MGETLNSSDPQISDEVMNEAEHQSLPQVQNPKTPPDTNSDSDSDDEAQETLQIQTLETELSQNPTNYDSHVQYIRALRKHGDIEKLRRAREAMSELFPLSPSMWQEWAKDETSLSSGPESFPAIEKLYERGVFDYLSVSLWCDYLNFVQEHEPSVRECSPAGVLKARNLFERALTAAGLHVTEGYKIWEAYREFELAIFYVIDETAVEAREKQVQRVRNIFHRQLSVTHSDLRSTLVAYKSWEAEQGSVLDVNNSSNLDVISSHIASAYQKALEMLDARILFEERIFRQDVSDMERLQEYMAYLKFEQSSGDPARVQILYERAVTEFPISNDLWLDYTRYLDRTLKASSIVKDVYSRATKNCPWVGELWVRYLLSLERGRASEKEISAVFEKSILCTFSSYDEYLDIFLTRVDGLRRRISQAGEVEDSLDYALIKETFQVTPRLEELQLFRLQQESINNGVVTNQRESSSKKISREKRKQGSNIADEQPTAKRQKGTAPNKMKGHGEDKVQENNSLERNKIETFQVHDGKGGNSHGKYTDQCTAFISNLGFQATYNDIHHFFNDGDGIVAIRILKDKYTGKSRGLAYVDFSDDAHLAAAVAKNKKTLMGKRLSIVRSDPKQRRMRESSRHHAPAEQEHGEMAENANEQTSALGESDSKDSSVVSKDALGSQPQSTPRHEDGKVQLKGKNIFAVPRAIRPLGWVDKNKPKTVVAEEGEDEKPKSNDEFRKMFLKT